MTSDTSTIEDKDKDLSNIKEIVTETHRRSKPMRGTEKQQKGLGKIGDFGIDSASDGLEKVRLKPVINWGKALLDGDDFLKFRLPTKGRKSATKNKKDTAQKPFTHSQTMYEVAKETYNLYSKGMIHKDFTPYLDEPVVGSTINALNELLEKNWKQYFSENQLLYMHWTFWFRVRNVKDVSEILKNVREGGSLEEIDIDGQSYKTVQLVRSLPIPFCPDSGGINSYYWLDRGFWYRIHAARFEAIRKRIEEITLKQEELFLPSYKFDASNKDYKELAYNKAAVEAMREQIGPEKLISEAILLDRESVSLGSGGDKFEFADILMQHSNGKYFLIHLKRERAGDFDHHRTQVERCALFLGENLDRRALPGLLITDILQDFYNKNIPLPKKNKIHPKTKEVKEVEQTWSSSFKEKFNKEKKTIDIKKELGSKKKRSDEFFERVRDDILNVTKKERLFIKHIVTSSEFEPLISDFEAYDDALFRCLDALEDFYLYGSKIGDGEQNADVSPDHIKFAKEFLERVLAFLKKHPSLTKKHQGILPHKERKNITIVLGIIGDDSGKEEFHNQQLWGIDETRKLVEKQGFSFQVVFVKDETKKTPDSDKDGAKSSDESEKSKNDEGNGGSTAAHHSVDPEDLKKAKENASELYGKDLGYKGVSDDIYCDKFGQKYVCVKLDGSEGDCCFHALKIKRKDLIEEMKTYIEECETKLLIPDVDMQVSENLHLRRLCNPMITTAVDQDTVALKGHPLLDWKVAITKAIDDEDEKKQLDAEFNVMIEQQGVSFVDWDKVLTSAQNVKKLVNKITAEDNELVLYKDFVEKCIADLWKRVADNQITREIEFHLVKVGVLSEKRDLLRAITDTDLDFLALKTKKENELALIRRTKPREGQLKQEKQDTISTLSREISRLSVLDKRVSDPKIKNYIGYTFEFSSALSERKKTILDEFYITNHECLDPSAIMDLGPRFGFKAKLFKKDDHFSFLRLDAQTPNAGSDDETTYRLMVHVNDNHYNLLFPIRVIG